MLNDTFWDALKSDTLKFEKSLENLFRKQTGSYYTGLDFATVMCKDLIENFLTNNALDCLQNKTFFEPCGGSGNFIFAFLHELYSRDVSTEFIEAFINNIYYCEVNPLAIKFYKGYLSKLLKHYFQISVSEAYFSEHIGSGLLFDVSAPKQEYIPLESIFPSLKNGVDILITNPPYKNFKAEKKHYENTERYEKDSQIYEEIKKLAQNHLIYSTNGTLNFYKLFVEEILIKYTKKDALVALLIPDSILSDKTCSKLRKYILLNSNVTSIKIIPEEADIVDAQQGLCAIQISKKGKTSNIQLYNDFYNNPLSKCNVNIETIAELSDDYNILPISEEEYKKLECLNKFPRIKDLPYIKNLRGELDITLNGKSITREKTEFMFLRGRNVNFYKYSLSDEFVDPEFVERTQKNIYIKRPRLICQQIVNKSKARRVAFALVPENMVLGNSCNFLSLDDNAPISLNYLLAILNSSIINWFFKISSSNNHINNYEIDEFPIPVNSPLKNEIELLVKRYEIELNEEILIKIDDLVSKAFCLDKGYTHMSVKLEESIKKGREEKALLISNNNVLNHMTFKLSDLDIECIKDVPEGGSWKDIPPEVIKKSRRLERITETGGRTTLYGRIDYSKPSYTITTYFNRPGNGTYVHPHFNRVISVREASRIQSFPDSYYFYGNKTQLLKQVGNAVPPIMAYQIAKQIIEKTGCKTSIDLFCGAGGLTCGFKMAGVKSVVANDIEESACATLAINNKEIPIVCGDITNSEIKESVIQLGTMGTADIICGGPPCQGFSLAGFRATDDPRNQLFRDFVDVVKEVNPKIVVFENVEGLLSYEGGTVYKEILLLFSELGYKCKGKLLNVSDYGVPQRRKRVIIICVRSDLGIEPEILYPEAITTFEATKTTAYEAIGDLESVECTPEAKYSYENESIYVKALKGKISIEEYLNNCKKKSSNPEYLQPSLF